MDQVGDAGAKFAEDGAQLGLSPAAQCFDGHAPARGKFVFVKGDARGAILDCGAPGWPGRLFVGAVIWQNGLLIGNLPESNDRHVSLIFK